MIFYWEKQNRRQYKIAQLSSGWTKAYAKHYPIWTAKVFEESKPDQFYFLKFTKLNETLFSKEDCEKAKRRFQNEGRFQVHHPSIEYVLGSGEGRLLFEEGDRSFLKNQNLKLDEIEDLQVREVLSAYSKQSQGLFGDCFRYLKQNDGEILFILTEYVEGKSLQDYYETDAFHPDREACRKQMFFHMRQAICAMDAYMNQNRIDPMLIRDITPSNFIITEKEKNLKYIDFDWSYIGEESRKPKLRIKNSKTGSKKRSEAQNGIIGKKQNDITSEKKNGAIGGTAGYLDPRQVFTDTKASDIQMDIYAMGMVFLYMMMGEDYIFSLPQVMELEEEMDYLRSRTIPYTLFRNCVRRNGRLVFTEPQFEPLFSIIEKMIARLENRYQTPKQILKDFDAFLESLYPESQNEFKDPLLLSTQETGKKTYCLCAVKNRETGKKTVQNYQIEDNMLVSIIENQVLIYFFRDKLYLLQLNEKANQKVGRIEITEKPLQFAAGSLQITLKRVL